MIREIKGRDIKGPQPFEFGRLSKNVYPKSSVKIEIDKNKAYDTRIKDLISEKKLVESENLKIDFFEDADRKAKIKTVKRNVDELMNQKSFLLNERRAKLKALLSDEQNRYEKEILSSAITPLERAAQLREKAKQIKLRKENEDALFVQEKLDQKWRSECDELRTFQSKQLQAGMRSEHLRQIEEKICRERHRLQEEAIFADLWYQDIEAKNLKEEERVKRVAHRNREISSILKDQMLVLEKQKQEEKKLRNENAKLIKEKLDIEKLEKEMNFQKKREEQANRRHELDLVVKAKLINEARRAKEELSFDLKALEESLISFQNEDEDRARRKQELLIEQQRYREYLKAEYEEEKRREKELERIIEEDVEKQFQKRLNEWKAQKQARKALLEKVIQGRKLQVEEKIKRNQERQFELEKEKEYVNKLVEIYKQQDIDEKQRLQIKIQKYGNDLLDQMEYNKLQKEMMNDSEIEANKKYVMSDEEYQKKLNDTMNMVALNSFNRRPDVNSGFCLQCKDELKI